MMNVLQNMTSNTIWDLYNQVVLRIQKGKMEVKAFTFYSKV